MLHISIQAEKIGSLFGLPITNSILTTWLVMLLLLILGFLSTRKLALVPSNGQSLLEAVVGGLYDLFKGITGDKTDQFFPLLASLFIFIITANWVGLLPGVGSIGIKEEVVQAQQETTDNNTHTPELTSETKLIPLFRGATADLNTTLALAIIAVASIQYFGIKNLGTKVYVSKFINFKNPIYFFVGILELVLEFAKIISFAFRLFGNIFAGEVLLTVIAFLIPVFAPLPFLALEVFVGFIQALVFSMLTAVFLNLAVSHEAH